jgi:hypothetical protein
MDAATAAAQHQGAAAHRTMLPFTHAQFIDVFVRYNAGIWPAQLVAYLLGLSMVAAILARPAASGRHVCAGLAVMWLWTGIAYHVVHFAAVNPAAYLFGALFVLQALLLLRQAVAGGLRFASRGPAAWLGWLLVSYAGVLYPLVGLWAGYGAGQLPMFGVTPCPLTLFTFGVLLLAAPPVPRALLAVPLAWSLVGGSAAALLHVPQDWPLLASALCVIVLWRRKAPRPRAIQPG